MRRPGILDGVCVDVVITISVLVQRRMFRGLRGAEKREGKVYGHLALFVCSGAFSGLCLPLR